MSRAPILLLPLLPLFPAAELPVAVPERGEKVHFQREILPLLQASCLACHNRTRAKADLVLESPDSILQGGASGPGVVPGKPEESLVYLAAAHLETGLEMPPEGNSANAGNLAPGELGLLQLWIREGASGEVSDRAELDWSPLPRRLRPIYAASLTPSGRFVAYGLGSQALVYDLFLQRHAARLEDPALGAGASHRDTVNAIDFSPQGDWIATGGFQEVKLWRRRLPVETLSLGEASYGRVTATALSGDRLHLAAGWDSGRLQVRHLPSGKVALDRSLEPAPVRGLALSGDGGMVAAIQGRDRISGFEVATGESLEWLPQGTAAAFARSGSRLAVVRPPDQVSLWREDPGGGWSEERAVSRPGVVSLAPLGHGPGQSLGLVGGEGSPARIAWDSAGPLAAAGPSQALPEVQAAGEDLWALASPDGRFHLWGEKDGEEGAWLRGEQALARKVARLEKGERLARTALDIAEQGLERAEKEAARAGERTKKAEEDRAAREAARQEISGRLEEARKKLGAAEEAVRQAAGRVAEAARKAEESQKRADQGAELLRKALASPEGEGFEEALAQVAESSMQTGRLQVESERVAQEAEAGRAARDKAVEEASKEVEDLERQLGQREQVLDLAQRESDLAAQARARAREGEERARQALGEAEQARDQAVEALEEARGAFVNRPLAALALSPDQDQVAALEPDGRLNVWRTDTRELLELVPLGEGSWISLHFLTGRSLAAVEASGLLKVVSLQGRWELHRTLGPGLGFAGRVHALDFSHDGRWLAAGGGEPSRSGEILLWDMEAMERAALWDRIHSDVVFGLEFSPGGRLLASGGADRFVRVVEREGGGIRHALEGHSHYVLDVSWQASGRLLASAGGNGEAKLWDAVSGEKRKDLAALDREVAGIGFLGEGGEVVAGSGRRMEVYGLDGRRLRTLEAPEGTVFAEAVSEDGRFVAAGGHEGVLRVWNASTGSPLATVGAR